MLEFLVHDLPQIILIGFGLYIVARSMGGVFFPRVRGTVVEFGFPLDGCGKNSGSVISVAVKLQDGSLERAEMSPCEACVDKITKGDVVALTRCGGRLIAQKTVSWYR